MIHEESRQTFLMNDGAKLHVDTSRHSELAIAYVPGQTNTVVTCEIHGRLGESYEALSVGWDAEDHAKELHGGLSSRDPISQS